VVVPICGKVPLGHRRVEGSTRSRPPQARPLRKPWRNFAGVVIPQILGFGGSIVVSSSDDCLFFESHFLLEDLIRFLAVVLRVVMLLRRDNCHKLLVPPLVDYMKCSIWWS
jgi:hypothetical protein